MSQERVVTSIPLSTISIGEHNFSNGEASTGISLDGATSNQLSLSSFDNSSQVSASGETNAKRTTSSLRESTTNPQQPSSPPMSNRTQSATFNTSGTMSPEQVLGTSLCAAAHSMAQSATLSTLEPYIHFLYTYRPLSTTILPIDRNADPDTKAIVYREIFDLLEANIMELDGFVRVLGDCVRVELAPLLLLEAHPVNEVHDNSPLPPSSETLHEKATLPSSFFSYSDYFFSNLSKIMDIFCQLNLIKSFKNSLSLDFTMYKRAFSFMRRDDLDEAALWRIQQLTEYSPLFQFIADKQAVRNLILNELKSQRALLDSLLAKLMHYCTRMLTAELYIVPEEKFRLLRVLIFSLTLLNDKVDVKTLPPSDAIAKLVKRYPVLPLYGDISFNCINTLSKLHILPKQLWEIRDERQLETQYLVGSYINEYEQEYNALLREHSALNIRINYLQREDARKMSEMPQQIRSQIMRLVKKSLHLMTQAKIRIMEQSAWKFSHPCSEKRVKEILGEKRYEAIVSQTNMAKQQDDDIASLEFDRVMRYNYTHEERSHLLRIVALLKNIESLLKENSVHYSKVIRGEIYAEIQQFCRSTMADHMYRAQKRQKKKEHLVELLQMLQQSFADGNSFPPMKRSKNLPPERVSLIQHEAPVPSLEQLNFGEDVLSILVHPDRPGMKKTGLFGKKDFKEHQLAEIRDFYNSFRHYRYLLDLGTTISSIGDLSDLYFKEFNFEITQRNWFPVKASLGYMLIKSTMSHCDEQVEKILNILHIYHDAAHRALFTIRKRHLFEEVRAELQLCLEYLSFKLSENIYKHYKEIACSQLLQEHDEDLVSTIPSRSSSRGKKASHKEGMPSPPDYSRLMQITSFPLLDSTFNLHEVLSSRVTDLILNNLRLAFSSFESEPITHIHSLEQMLMSIETTHSFLSEHLSLPPYQQLLAQADERSSHTSMDGRLMNHIVSEVCFFLTQEMVFDLESHQFRPAELLVCQELNSYERSSPPTLEDMYAFGTSTMASMFQKISQSYQNYFGREHVEVLQRLCGNSLWPLLSEAAFEFVHERLNREVHLFVRELYKALPSRSRLPNALKLSQLFYFIDTRFRDFRSYEGMPEALHCFRLIGNILSFVLLLDCTLEGSSVYQRISMAPFLDLKPIAEMQRTLRRAERKKMDRQGHYISTMNIPSVDRTSLMQDVLKNIPESSEDHLHGSLAQQVYDSLSLVEERSGTSLFSSLLSRLADETLTGDLGKFLAGEESLSHIDNSPSFFKLWTVLEYFFHRKSYFVTLTKDDNTHEEKRLSYSRIFGDGVSMCSLTLIHLLHHRFRFESFNFLNHISNLKQIEEEAITEVELQKFLSGISRGIFKSQLLFSILHSHYEVEYSFEEFSPPESLNFNVVQSIPRSPEFQLNTLASPLIKKSPGVSLSLSVDSPHIRGDVNDSSFVDEDSYTDTSMISNTRFNINLAEEYPEEVEISNRVHDEDVSENQELSTKDSDADHKSGESKHDVNGQKISDEALDSEGGVEVSANLEASISTTLHSKNSDEEKSKSTVAVDAEDHVNEGANQQPEPESESASEKREENSQEVSKEDSEMSLEKVAESSHSLLSKEEVWSGESLEEKKLMHEQVEIEESDEVASAESSHLRNLPEDLLSADEEQLDEEVAKDVDDVGNIMQEAQDELSREQASDDADQIIAVSPKRHDEGSFTMKEQETDALEEAESAEDEGDTEAADENS
uniref:Uncharacterized protein n=1 Tax=Percolomonas cosmopolitus TaxID=63605 RepID=A0A7S1KR93_9EUKA|mmetsp:Transcript_5974/g.22666  ORF Transcript_5974/g.22666 Transcript_5974/m.22666 type:complete len:1716 (+) Transcript_5974:74-5221(+)